MTIDKVNIRPGVEMMSVLKHTSYDPWYALAEFVDNAVQSYNANRESLSELDGVGTPLKVEISHDKNAKMLKIRDSAAGISRVDYERAFQPGALPTDRSGLSEFGMGMKLSACWFSPRWEVQTKALGEPVNRTIKFDIDKIVNDGIEELDVIDQPEKEDAHYTEIRLYDLYKPLQSRTVSKIKDHLQGIYRQFIRDRELILVYNDDKLKYTPPKILKAPYFKDFDGPAVDWKKDIDFDLGGGLRVKGFAALREKGNTARAGFALFRRGRVIQGSADEGYRPIPVFGRSNSFSYQRLFGELHLSGFDVAHTKNGFVWDENEEPFLDLLKDHINTDPLPLIKQAEGHRTRRKKEDIVKGATAAADNVTKMLGEQLPGVMETIEGQRDEEPSSPTAVEDLETPVVREVEFKYENQLWRVEVRCHTDRTHEEWLSVEGSTETDGGVNTLTISMALLHPYMDRFSGERQEDIEPFLRIAAALGVAEHYSKLADIDAERFREYFNEVLRTVGASP